MRRMSGLRATPTCLIPTASLRMNSPSSCSRHLQRACGTLLRTSSRTKHRCLHQGLPLYYVRYKGLRLFTLLATHMASLRRSPEYHSRQTRKARQHSTGASWRGLATLSLDLPNIRTPLDGPRAYPPEKRHLMDCTEILDVLRAIPKFPRRALMGRSKTVATFRINLLAGLAPLTAGPTAKGKSTLTECPFCDACVTDTLHHCLYDCTMNRHTGEIAWCAEAVHLIRHRFRSNALTAMLELGCPFDTSSPIRLPRAPPTDRLQAQTTPVRLQRWMRSNRSSSKTLSQSLVKTTAANGSTP